MLVLPRHLQYGEKNPLYIGQNPTPNELWLDDGPDGLDHRSFISDWYQRSLIPNPPRRWFEVRIIKNNFIDDIGKGSWWEDALWHDKVFWVDQKPLTEEINGQKVQFYILDYWECQRVREILKVETGKEPFRLKEPALLVPVDCCQICWEETSNGYSDHIRDRNREKDPLQKIKEEIQHEKIMEASKRIVDIDPDDFKFQTKLEETLKIVGK